MVKQRRRQAQVSPLWDHKDRRKKGWRQQTPGPLSSQIHSHFGFLLWSRAQHIKISIFCPFFFLLLRLRCSFSPHLSVPVPQMDSHRNTVGQNPFCSWEPSVQLPKATFLAQLCAHLALRHKSILYPLAFLETLTSKMVRFP